MTTPGRRPSVRRKIAVATWRAPKEGRLHARMAVDATALLAYCAEQRAATGTPISPAAVVGLAFQRGVEQVPAFHNRVVFGRIVPFPSYDVGFAVDIEGGDDLAPKKVRAADTKTVAQVAAELVEGAERLRARGDRDFQTTNGIARWVPWFLLRPVVALASLLNGGIGVRAFGQPAHPLGSLFVTNIGSFGLDEGYVAPVPPARVPLYVCVGAIADAAVVEKGKVVVRPQVVITATADHRLVDGAHAAKLARIVRALLAEPRLIDTRETPQGAPVRTRPADRARS
jgi:pyruvate dehydrogenase E2 component (dihydrolipoamide acetyltransferase)